MSNNLTTEQVEKGETYFRNYKTFKEFKKKRKRKDNDWILFKCQYIRGHL